MIKRKSGSADTLRTRLDRHAVPFLASLHQCSLDEAWNVANRFQTFQDAKASKKSGLSKHWLQSLDEAAPELDRLNKEGAGVFMTVNRTDGRGRKKPNIEALFGHHVDIDSKDASAPFDLDALPIKPTMAVRTPGGWHLYWLAQEPMPCEGEARWKEHEEELRGIQFALSRFGADLKSCTVERVLRLPGFMHCKEEPRLVELLYADGPRYTRDQIRAAFPPVARQRSSPTDGGVARATPADADSDRSQVTERAGNYLDRCDPAIQGENGSTATFNAALKIIGGFDLTEDEALALLCERYNSRCVPQWSVEELRHKAHDAWQVAQQSMNRGHLLEDHGRPRVPGFEWSERGLYYVKQSEGQDDDGNQRQKRVWIAPPFSLPCLVRDAASHGWRVLLTWADMDGAPHEASLPFELISSEGTELARILAQGGLMLPPGSGLRCNFQRYLALAARQIRNRALLVDSLGWHDGAFILPGGEMIGSAVQPMRYAGETGNAGLHSLNGTLEDWKREVAMRAVGNPRLAFALSCAFAGPLLALLRPDGGGGFNLMGSSSKGKTTCLEAAASVWGRPDPLPTWRATSNGLEGLAAPRNDGFLVLDELSQVDAKEAGAVAYMLANGSAKARMSKDGEGRRIKKWCLIFLSTGEQSIEDKVGEDGKRVKAGQEVRVPDIPCPPEGMFDNSHGFEGFGPFAEALKGSSRKHYGHPSRAFLAALCKLRSNEADLRLKLQSMEAAWLADALHGRVDGQVRRVAGRFALVAVAGELAREVGVLPWAQGEAVKGAHICFQAWLKRRGHMGASERERGLQAVVDYLNRFGLSRFAEWSATDSKPNDMAGVRKRALGEPTESKFGTRAEQEGWDFYFSTSGWKEACRGFDSQAVARDAMEDGLIEPGPQGRPYRKERTPHRQGQWYVIRAAALGDFRSDGTG